VDGLLKNTLTSGSHYRVDLVTRLAAAQWRVGLLGHVLDEDHGASGGAEGLEQLRHVLLRAGIVARSPVGGVIETGLDVNQEEDGVAR
jgi:hypothetical protein